MGWEKWLTVLFGAIFKDDFGEFFGVFLVFFAIFRYNEVCFLVLI